MLPVIEQGLGYYDQGAAGGQERVQRVGDASLAGEGGAESHPMST